MNTPTPHARSLSGQPLMIGAALGVALLLPLAYFGLGYQSLSSSLATKAAIKAEIINQQISASPDTWRYQEHRLQELLERVPIELGQTQAVIRDTAGVAVASSPGPAPAWRMTRQAGLYDAGVPAGHVELHHSLTGLLTGTAGTAALGLLLSAVLMSGLRSLQRRGDKLQALMQREQERARVTLHAIGDAVITTDGNELIETMNPAAEQLTQWPLAEARGRALAEVCPLIDETTLKACANPARDALRTQQARPFDGHLVGLMRRDGSSISIEPSTAPLRDAAGTVLGAALVFHDVSAVRRMARRISWSATHDVLTGLANRREFESQVESAVFQARYAQGTSVLAYIDLDQFKVLNDTCGHGAGDGLLKLTATQLQARLRASDTLARLGGDEFGVLLHGCQLAQGERVVADLLAAIRDIRYPWEGQVFNISASIGVVEIHAQSSNATEVFSAADTACFAAKEQGRNRVCTFRHSDAAMSRTRDEMGWATRLTRALEERRLRLYYQRYQSLGALAGENTHLELLLRLEDEDGRIVPPGCFLPAAERYNLMPAIDRWVISEAFARHADLCVQMGGPLTCAINLSGASLNAEGLLEHIRAEARRHALPHGAICFELTETVAVNNLRHAAEFMREVKQLGFHFALDDFGVGTSSFGYLKSLPVDYLKIDGSFVKNIAHDPVERAMAETINRIGHIMGLQTVGEFAESAEVIEALRAMGVDYAQGYGVHRPEPLPAPLATDVPLQRAAQGARPLSPA